MKRNFLFLLVAFCFLTINVGVFAGNNPANLDASSDYCDVVVVKSGFDGNGSRFLCFSIPVGEETSICVFDWQNKQGDVSLSELYIAKRVSPWLDITLDSTFSDGLPVHKMVIDVFHEVADSFQLGVATAIPLAGKGILFGPRATLWGVSGFLTIPTEKEALGKETDKKFYIQYGVGYTISGVSVDGAYGKNKFFLRVSKGLKISSGILIPELRLVFPKGKKEFGFALGFVPAQ